MQRKKNFVWGPCKLNLWNVTLFLFFPSFVLLLYLCNGYKLHRLKRRIKNTFFFFFFTCYFKDIQRNKQLWYWNSIVPAPPEHNPKKTENRLLGCLQYACVNISVCCSHIIFLLKVPLGIKTLCFLSVVKHLLVLTFFNLWGILFIG